MDLYTKPSVQICSDEYPGVVYRFPTSWTRDSIHQWIYTPWSYGYPRSPDILVKCIDSRPLNTVVLFKNCNHNLFLVVLIRYAFKKVFRKLLFKRPSPKKCTKTSISKKLYEFIGIMIIMLKKQKNSYSFWAWWLKTLCFTWFLTGNIISAYGMSAY